MDTFWMKYNEHKNTEFDVQVVERPNVPSPERRISYILIAGRDGTLSKTDNTYNDIEIEVKLNFLTRVKENFMVRARLLKNWLTGSGELKFSDDSEVFYKVKNVALPDKIERVLKRAGFFSALFTCDPFTYFESGRVKSTIDECKVNPYHESLPTFYIYGNGNCILTVNGNSTTVHVNDNLIINTELMIMHKENGAMVNNSARCEYEKFHLQNGFNEITISRGFELKIEPNWRSL